MHDVRTAKLLTCGIALSMAGLMCLWSAKTTVVILGGLTLGFGLADLILCTCLALGLFAWRDHNDQRGLSKPADVTGHSALLRSDPDRIVVGNDPELERIAREAGIDVDIVPDSGGKLIKRLSKLGAQGAGTTIAGTEP
jgi:hypothetical protein